MFQIKVADLTALYTSLLQIVCTMIRFLRK